MREVELHGELHGKLVHALRHLSLLHHMLSKSQLTLLPWSEVNQCYSFISRDRKMPGKAWGQASLECSLPGHIQT